MHVGLRVLDLVGDPRQRRRTVDQDLEPSPLAWRRVAAGEAARRCVEDAETADPREPPAVVRDDEPLNPLAHGTVQS
jgi:hypothetical protein